MKWLKRLFRSNKVTKAELKKILEETGLLRDEKGLFFAWLYPFAAGKGSDYIDIVEKYRELKKRFDALVEYLGVESRHTAERDFYAKRPKKQARKKS